MKHYTDKGYRAVTGQSPDEALRFLDAALSSGVRLWIRHVAVPGLTDGEKHFTGLWNFLRTLRGVEKVELLPYHVLGVSKYHTLGIPCPLEHVPPMEPEALVRWQQVINNDLTNNAPLTTAIKKTEEQLCLSM